MTMNILNHNLLENLISDHEFYIAFQIHLAALARTTKKIKMEILHFVRER